MVLSTQIKRKPKKSDISENEISINARVAHTRGNILSEEEASFELKLKSERVIKEIEKETRSH